MQGQMNSIGNMIGGYMNTQTKAQNTIDPLQLENGLAEYNNGKRKIIWKLKNVKGQMTKTLDVSLTYFKD